MSTNKSKVVVIPCDSYDEEKVYNKLKAGLAELGGFEKIVSPEENQFLAP